MTDVRDPSAEANESRDETLTEPERRLIQVQAVFVAALAVAGVFLSLYLFTVGGFRAIALFYGGQYLIQPIFFIASGYALRRHSSKQLVRVGLLLVVILYVLLLFLQDKAQHYAFYLGLLSGIGEGLYWPGINLSEYVSTHQRTRNLYYGRLFAMSNIASIIGLPVGGIILTVARYIDTPQTGYYALFGVLIVMLLLTYKLSAGVSAWSQVNFSASDMVQHRRTEEWQLVLWQNVLRGLWVYTLPAFSSVLLFKILEHELSLSILAAATTVLAGVASLLAGRILHRRPRSFLLGALIVPFGLLGFSAEQNWAGILCYSLLIMAFDPFAQNFAYSAMYNVMDGEGKSWRDTYHFIVEREIAWNLGRIISFFAMYFVLSSGDQVDALRRAIMVAAVLPIVVGLMQYRLHVLTRGASARAAQPAEQGSARSLGS